MGFSTEGRRGRIVLGNAGIILLLESIFDREKITMLQKNGWLPSYSKVEIASFDKRDFLSVHGLDVEDLKLPSLSVGTPCFLFTSLHFSRGGFVYANGDFACVTSTHWENSSPIVNLLLYTLKWAIRKEIICDNPKCLVSSFDDKIIMLDMCFECQKKISIMGQRDLLSIGLTMKALSNELSFNIEEVVAGPIENALQRYKIQSSFPCGNVQLTEKIIDYSASEGSPHRSWLAMTAKEVYRNKNEIRDKYLNGPSQRPKLPTIIAARRWNSWTPARPAGIVKPDGEEMKAREI